MHDPSIWFESVDLRSDPWRRPKVLPVAVACISKPEVSGIPVLFDVIQGGEILAEEVVDEHTACPRRWINECQP